MARKKVAKLKEKKLAPKKETVEKFIAIRDITLKYRKGDVVPDIQIKHWEMAGVIIEKLVEKR